jgi:hypothetical protein
MNEAARKSGVALAPCASYDDAEVLAAIFVKETLLGKILFR